MTTGKTPRVIVDPDIADRVVAACPDPISAQKTVEVLLAAGIRKEDIEIISSVPLAETDFSAELASSLADDHNPGRMPWFVLLGAVVGGTGGFLLASLTQKSYPIATGGMAIVPLWTDGIITYELTMLGAILTTLLVLILIAPLLRRRRQSSLAAEDAVVVEITPMTSNREEILKMIAAQAPQD